MNEQIDWEHPPLEPPAQAVQPMLWRLAARLLHDHVPGSGTGPTARCAVCGQWWPCPARGYAERGLVAACRPPVTGRGAASFVDWFLGPEAQGRGPDEGPGGRP